MSIVHNWEKNGLYIQYLDHVTGEDMLDDALVVSGDPRFDNMRYVISDWTQATTTAIDTHHIHQLVAYVKAMARSNPKVKNATVMYDDEDRKAMVALYGLLADDTPWKIDFFNTLEEARSWVAAE